MYYTLLLWQTEGAFRDLHDTYSTHMVAPLQPKQRELLKKTNKRARKFSPSILRFIAYPITSGPVAATQGLSEINARQVILCDGGVGFSPFWHVNSLYRG